RPPTSTPFPYTTLFRSGRARPFVLEEVAELALRQAAAIVLAQAPVTEHARRLGTVAAKYPAHQRLRQRAIARENFLLSVEATARSEEHTSELQSLAYLV